MRARVSLKGQITLPAGVRRKLGLIPGTLLEFDLQEDGVFVRKAHPVDQVLGILKLDKSTDELLDEMRGPRPEAMLFVRAVGGTQDWEGARAVRRRVFIEEQGVAENEEWDELDETAHHIVALFGGQVIGTGRLVEQQDGVGRVGRMAVQAERRRQGVGGAMLAALEEEAVRRGLRRIVLHAQEQAIGFYERVGYVAEGEVFEEAGIRHRAMWKALG
jgi:AbrB family looped-hinge helix DNA binding protein